MYFENINDKNDLLLFMLFWKVQLRILEFVLPPGVF